MGTRLNPYLGFRDNAAEAFAFYHKVFGGELRTATFADYNATDDPTESDKLMHAQLITKTGLMLMGADTPNSMPFSEESKISVSLSGGDEEELQHYWDGLSEGAQILEPLKEAPWGDKFGMLMDRFGVTWLINIAPPGAM